MSGIRATAHIVTALLLPLLTACGSTEPAPVSAPTPAPAPAPMSAPAPAPVPMSAPAPVSATTPAQPSVPARINDRFLDPDLDPDAWTKRWEVESREIYAERHAIAAAVQLRAGEDVADVGAGTGLFLARFSQAVGAGGHVYAVEISPRFVEHIRQRTVSEDLANVEAVLSREDSTTLPRGAVDAAFLCDTYHHFGDHEAMLRSLRETIRPGGRLVIVDFERIPGVSRDWVIGHVRAGKEQVIAEVESGGFELEDEITIPGLRENYVVRFRRP